MSKRNTRILTVVAVAIIACAAVAEYTIEPLRSVADVVQWVLVAALLLGAREVIVRLDRSESKLRALVGSLNDAILILDQNGTYLDIPSTNPALLYKPLAQLIGRRIHDVFPKEQADAFVAEIHRALQSPHPTSVDYVVNIEGKEVWFNASVTRLDDSTVMWVARDITERKSAEIELEKRVAERTREVQRSEARYRTVFEQAEEIIFTISPDGIITSLNPAFERTLAWSCEQWVGKPFVGLVPAEAAADCARLFDILQRKGRLDLVRVIALHKNGSRVALEMTARQKIANGELRGFVGVARDVTRRDLDEAKLRNSERQLAEAQEMAKIGSFDHNLTTHTLVWSEQLYRMFGLEPSSDPLPETAFIDMVVEEDRPKIAEVQRIVVARGEHDWEIRLRGVDGIVRMTRCHGKLLVDPVTANTRFFGAVRDITEERHAEELLKQSEERFRLVTLATSDAVWDVDIRNNVTWLSEGFRRFGHESGSVARDDWWADHIHPDDRQNALAKVDEALQTGATLWEQEYRFRRGDGTYAFVLDRGCVVRDAEKRPVRLVGALLDMTERKQLLDQLEQAKRVSSLGRVAASIAHEFNNILMGIQPNVEVIQRSSPSGLRTVTDNIVRAVQRGKRVTDEILRFTRPAEPNRQSLNVAEFFAKWREETQALLGLVELSIEVPDEPIYVSADPMQLAQIFTNLALNARDAMQDRPGRLTIRGHVSSSFGAFPFGVVKSPDRFVHFSVTDEGCGISTERLNHIFEPLFTTKRGGIGLGLAVTYQIVTRHEGHIFVESEVGKGSTFHVFIPAALPESIEQTDADASKDAAIKRLVLVEDEPAVASGIAMLLEMEGIDVTTVYTGGDAIPAIDAKAPDAVILDIGLPDMDGVGVYLEIQRRWPKLPVLFSSGHGDSAKLETYLSNPNVGFILKPYDFDTMRAQLAKLVEQTPAALAC